MKFNVGMKVDTPKGRGEVEEVISMPGGDIIIVRLFEDNSLCKMLPELIKIVEEEPEEKKSVDTITITREEFRDKITDVISDIMSKSMVRGANATYLFLTMFGPIIGAEIETALFGLPEKNV